MASNTVPTVSESSNMRSAFEALTDRLSHLESSLSMIYGEGLETFMLHSDQQKDSYLCGCTRLAQEALEFLQQLEPAVYGQRQSHLQQAKEARHG